MGYNTSITLTHGQLVALRTMLQRINDETRIVSGRPIGLSVDLRVPAWEIADLVALGWVAVKTYRMQAHAVVLAYGKAELDRPMPST